MILELELMAFFDRNPPNNKHTSCGEYDDYIAKLGDRIANLTLLEAKELNDYVSLRNSSTNNNQ